MYTAETESREKSLPTMCYKAKLLNSRKSNRKIKVNRGVALNPVITNECSRRGRSGGVRDARNGGCVCGQNWHVQHRTQAPQRSDKSKKNAYCMFMLAWMHYHHSEPAPRRRVARLLNHSDGSSCVL